MLTIVKKSLRITTTIYDDEIKALISAAQNDLALVGIPWTRVLDADDSLIVMAVVTYVRFHFGSPADFEKLKASYDEQKAQLMIAHGYGGGRHGCR